MLQLYVHDTHFHYYSEEHLLCNINQIIGEQTPHTISRAVLPLQPTSPLLYSLKQGPWVAAVLTPEPTTCLCAQGILSWLGLQESPWMKRH